jgi:serine/threonine protein kinase/WD40 repeat protein/tetratricopeptide (TPR) repeat protein
MNEPQSELDAVGRVAEAFLARYRRGSRPSLAEYTEKYPELAEQIRDLFPALVVLEELGSVEGPRPAPPGGTAPGKGQAPEHLGDYRVLREVGRGGMGVVYEAVQESLGRHVALKVLPSHGLLPSTHLERFRREARAAARLHHTNIVPVFGVGEHEGTHYYAMQFIQGQGLHEVLTEVRRLRGKKGLPPAEGAGPGPSQSLARGLLSGQFAGAGGAGPEGEPPAVPQTEGSAAASPLPPVPFDPPTAPGAAGPASGTELTAQTDAQYFRSVARMGAQVAAALDYAHKQGILHRDVKPSNLLLDARGTVWVTDFGLAKAEGADELTHPGDIVGTLRYMAPERFQGWSDPRSDVYGLGVTLYELLTLRPAFEDCSRPRLIERVTHEDPPRPRRVDPSVPRDLETIVLKAIDKEPGRRYQTAAELAEDLRRFLAGEPVRARRVGASERAVKWVKRRPTAAALLAVSAAAALSLTVGAFAHNAQLGAALQKAETNLEKARRAEEQARRAEQEQTRQLAVAHVREAQVVRSRGLVGRRFESLEALKKAAELIRGLGELDEQRAMELRNEAIICLLLADLKPGKAWAPRPGWSHPVAFDPTLQTYAVRASWADQPKGSKVSPGQLSVRRVADDQEVAPLPGFGARAVWAQFSPDGRYLAAHYEQGPRHNYVWDLGRREAVLKVPQGGYESYPAFSPDSRLVALPRSDHSIRIYELPSGAVRKDLPPGPPVFRAHFHPDGRRLAVVSGITVRLRDLSDGKELATFKHPGRVFALAWRADGKVFATGCFDNDIYLWDVANPAQHLWHLKGHSGPVAQLCFSHAGDLLQSESWDSTVRLWDTGTGQQLVSTPAGWSDDHQFSPDDRRLDHRWQVATGRECRTFQGGKKLTCVAVSPNGRLLASVSADGTRLWDLAAEREGDKFLATLPHSSSLAAHFDPKDGSLITASKITGLERWPVAPGAKPGELVVGPPRSLGSSARAPFLGDDPDFALSPDGRTVAYCPQAGQAVLFDPEGPGRQLVIEAPRLRSVSFSRSDGRWLATGNWQGRGVRVWDARTGEPACPPFELGEAEGGSAWPAFSPDGKWLVTGTFAEYCFWEAGTWRKKYALPRENAGRSTGWIAFAPDGKVVALLHGVSGVRLVDPGTGREYARLPAAGTPYCFSPDGSQLVTAAARDGAFQVWDLRLLRRQLAEMGLDWGLPPYPPPAERARPLRVRVLGAEPLPPSKELDAQAHLERGLLYVRLRDHSAAWPDFKRAAALGPKRPPWEEVVRAYSQAIERAPEDAEAYHLRAHARERLGQWREAAEDHSRAITRAPQRPVLLACRGRAYLRAGKRHKAAEDFRRAAGRGPDQANRVAWELATSPAPLDREPGLAVELATQAVRQAPESAAYWTTLGAAHYRAGQWEAGLRALEQAEKLAPGKAPGHNVLFMALCRHRLGDPVTARDNYDRGVRWCEEHRGKLSATQQRELQALRAEAEALLRVPPPGH